MDHVPIPAALRERYAGWRWSFHYGYAPGAGAQTWHLRKGNRTLFLKVAHAGGYPDIAGQAERLRWAAEFLPVPRLVEQDSADGVDWSITAGLPGQDATAPDLIGDPSSLVVALAEGLRRFHAVPIAGCPFDFRLDAALAHVERRARAGLIDPRAHFHPEFEHHSVETALAELSRLRPQAEDLVVCHGDYCLPNVLLEGGQVTGYLDIGELGVVDRWWDVAVGAWSVTWNLGAGWEDLFYATYGIDRDDDRIRFYRLLYDLVS